LSVKGGNKLQNFYYTFKVLYQQFWIPICTVQRKNLIFFVRARRRNT
jgi:hypothetical protein